MRRVFLLGGIVVFLLLSFSSNVFAVDAFPGAEGSGRNSTGGRGGDVYEVTNLTNDANSGSGSIVDAVSAGNRTIVFRISGTIELGDVILKPKSNTTIAGQTAPGDGICIKGRIKLGEKEDPPDPGVDADNIIIRYIRVRVDEGAANSDGDAIDIARGNNIIIDHVSASYARDEGISSQEESDNVTVQWCIMSEALNEWGHSYGSLIRGEYGQEKTYHHNLYAHNKGRNPRPGNYTSSSSDPEGLHFDFRNNVVYNWDGSTAGYNDDGSEVSRYNFIGNNYIQGLDSSGEIAFRDKSEVSYGYFSDNSMNDVVPGDPWSLVNLDMSSSEITAYKARSYLVPMGSVTTSSPAQAKTDVLGDAGASFPSRDAVDSRIVNDVINGTGNIINLTSDLADPWPTLSSLPAPTDTDHDGMPDVWESAQSLDPNDDADRNYYDLSGDYTNLEVYLNSLVADDTTAPDAPTGLAATAGDGTVSLDWNNNSEVDLHGYNAYRSTTSGSGYTKINSSLLYSSDYNDNSVTNGTTYYYVVTAVDTSWNESNDSNEDSATPIDVTAPSAPTGLTAAPGDGTVGLDWNDNVEGDLDGYDVYRSTTSGSGYSKLNVSLLGSSDYTDNSVTNRTTYYYVVKAVDTSSNESGYSSEESATPSVISGSMGTILREWWTGISGSLVSDLTSDVNFPDNPSGSEQLTSLEAPTNWADSYGTLIRGYLHPPKSGSYTFWIASDADSELWLSTDGTPENALKIANVSGSTNPREWDKYPSQESSVISLSAGQKYYIEVLHKEDSSNDNLSVSWSGPGISQRVIDGIYLSPWFMGLYGDSTSDDTVDMNDLPDFIAMWLEDDCALSSAWDLNGDCVINFYEYSAMSWNWMVTEPDTNAPAAPTGLSATAGDGTVSLDWDDNSEADVNGYNIYRSTTSGSGYSQLNVSLLGTSDYTDDSVTNGITYYYVVTAVDTSSNESGYSSEDSATPSEPVTSITIQENETGFCGVDGIIEDEWTGYTGDGYANTNNDPDTGVDYSVNILTAGTYTFTWRYANGSSDRPADLIINSSTEASGISFPGTGAWTSWSTTGTVNVSLTTGIKNIRLEETTGDGLANIDYMEITGPNLTTASCP